MFLCLPNQYTLKMLSGDLVVSCQYLNGSCKKEEDRLFIRVCCDRTKENGFKLKEGRFRLDIMKKPFYDKGSKAVGQIPQRGGGCVSLKGLWLPPSCLWPCSLQGGLDLMVFKSHFSFKWFYAYSAQIKCIHLQNTIFLSLNFSPENLFVLELPTSVDEVTKWR